MWQTISTPYREEAEGRSSSDMLAEVLKLEGEDEVFQREGSLSPVGSTKLGDSSATLLPIVQVRIYYRTTSCTVMCGRPSGSGCDCVTRNWRVERCSSSTSWPPSHIRCPTCSRTTSSYTRRSGSYRAAE